MTVTALTKLNRQQHAFADLILAGKTSAAHAYTTIYGDCSKASAYSKASQLLHHPKVQAYLQEKYMQLSEHQDISLEEVAGTARKVIERSLVEVPVLDGEGNPTGEFKYDSLGVCRANQQLIALAGLDKTAGGDRTMVIFNINIDRTEPEQRVTNPTPQTEPIDL